jgi:hypothetical protein
VYTPLYPPEGGPLMGFACRECGDVTKTEAGMIRHCFYAHGKRPQLELELENDSEAVRHVRYGQTFTVNEEPGSGGETGSEGTSWPKKD